jgi:hypothetical protein
LKTTSHLGAILCGALAEEVIEDLTPAHANPLTLTQGLADVHLCSKGVSL